MDISRIPPQFSIPLVPWRERARRRPMIRYVGCVICDTSTLMHDPLLLEKCVKNQVLSVIPYTTMRELNGLKTQRHRPDAMQRAIRASHVIDRLSEKINNYFEMENSVENDIHIPGFSFGMSGKTNDDTILKCALRVQEEITSQRFLPRENIFFLTDDRILRIMGRAHGITSLGLNEFNAQFSRMTGSGHTNGNNRSLQGRVRESGWDKTTPIRSNPSPTSFSQYSVWNERQQWQSHNPQSVFHRIQRHTSYDDLSFLRSPPPPPTLLTHPPPLSHNQRSSSWMFPDVTYKYVNNVPSTSFNNSNVGQANLQRSSSSNCINRWNSFSDLSMSTSSHPREPSLDFVHNRRYNGSSENGRWSSTQDINIAKKDQHDTMNRSARKPLGQLNGNVPRAKPVFKVPEKFKTDAKDRLKVTIHMNEDKSKNRTGGGKVIDVITLNDDEDVKPTISTSTMATSNRKRKGECDNGRYPKRGRVY